MDYSYISVTTTAKMLRGALAKAFPGIKFSVRSSKYAGGASIDIGWVDGPLTKQVDELVNPYKGAGFDGMIDMQYCNKAWLLPDGSVTFAGTSGTEGSMGTVPKEEYPAPIEGAVMVRFLADYIFTNRKYSVGMYTRAAEKVCNKFGLAMPMIAVSSYDGSPRLAREVSGREMGGGEDLATLIYRDLQKRTNYIKAAA